MKIETLGTGHGDPGDTRYHSSALLNVGSGRYLIDAGEPVDTILWRKHQKSSDLWAIFITHMHCDHVGSIPELIKTAIKYPNDTKRPLKIFLPDVSAIMPLKSWLSALSMNYPSPLIEIKAYRAGEIYQDENITVSAFPTEHLSALDGGPGSYALRIDATSGSFVYTGDLRNDFSDFPKEAFAIPCEMAFCELTHFRLAEAIDTFHELSVKKIIFTHILNYWDTNEGDEDFCHLTSSLPMQVVKSNDGAVYSF